MTAPCPCSRTALSSAASAVSAGRGVLRPADRSPYDLRRSSGDRDRERAAVQRDPRKRSSSRRQRARSCGSSAARRPTSDRSSRPSLRMRCGYAGRRMGRSLLSTGSTIRVALRGPLRSIWRRRGHPRPAAAPSGDGWSLDRRTIHVEDIMPAEADFSRPGRPGHHRLASRGPAGRRRCCARHANRRDNIAAGRRPIRSPTKQIGCSRPSPTRR